jgi:hypothetical protein
MRRARACRCRRGAAEVTQRAAQGLLLMHSRRAEQHLMRLLLLL